MAGTDRSDPAEPLSAEVVLRGPAGERIPPVTAANLERYRPPDDAVSAARRWFEDRGFTTTPLGGISFTLTGPRALFDATFGVDLGTRRPGVDVLELPLPDLPPEVAAAVDAVSFSPPPDFGPPSY